MLNLSAVPSSLKVIAPYLQRADELYEQEPIVAYWSIYYAAQTGISAKARDDASRDYLKQLLITLEKTKEEIGPNDAIDMEAASAAYVENFALKVFSTADNEDRRGESNRSTAKKFLAAANFLEILKVFPQTHISESIEEKTRYAKWKAADIAKAFREGRKPMSGPAGQAPLGVDSPTVPPLSHSVDTATSSSASTPSTGHSAHGHSSTSGSPKGRHSPPSIKRSSPTPLIEQMPPPQPLTLPRPSFGQDPVFDPSSPGNWSTAATPGTTTVAGTPSEDAFRTGATLPIFNEQHGTWSQHYDSSLAGKSKPREGLPSHSRGASESSNGTVSSDDRKDGASPKRVHFLPNAGGSSAPTAPPQAHSHSYSRFHPSLIYSSNAVFPSPPASFDPALLGFEAGSAPPLPPHHTSPHVPQPPTANGSAPLPPTSTPSLPPLVLPPPELKPVEVELTPAVIAKAQKHCRFAISALDYEDAEIARKELRAALAVLGG